MRRLRHQDRFYLVLLIFLFWRIFLFLPQIWSDYFLPQKSEFFGPLSWANFDGEHYLLIAQNGYGFAQQAFFPFFPLALRIVDILSPFSISADSFLFVHLVGFGAVYFFYLLVKELYGEKTAIKSVVFLLSFPTAFFLVAYYTEGIFLLLLFSSLYFLQKSLKQKNLFYFFLAIILGGLLSSVRIIGVGLPAVFAAELKRRAVAKKQWFFILFLPAGLLTYMVYLAFVYGDPLLFLHTQPLFGAGRSGGEIVFFPQIIYRYIKIFLVNPTSYEYWIAMLEFVTFSIVSIVILLAAFSNIRKSYVLFSFFALLIPTLSGTFSSLPRYALLCFVMYIFFAKIESKGSLRFNKRKAIQFTILVICLALQVLLAGLFLSGHFVS